MTASIFATGLREAVSYFEALPDIAEKSAVTAINQVASRDGLAIIRQDMRKQINFPKGYLEKSDRLFVSRKARKGSLEAVITGRDRATSLARFAQAGQRPENTRGRGIRVEVKNGKVQRLDRAFLIPLRNGNMGLTVRLKPGEQIRNSQRAVKLADNVYLLYGPSVDQVFRTVAEDRAEDLAERVTNQFLRQFARFSNG